MELWSLIIGVASLIVGIISIILALVAMRTSKEESKKSEVNYQNTKELLNEIEHKTELIDRSVVLIQGQLINIVNSALDKIDKTPVDFEPISLAEIDEIFGEFTTSVEIPNNATGGKTVIIDKIKNIGKAIEKELSEI